MKRFIILLSLSGLLLAGSAKGQGPEDAREVEGRAAFARADYAKALEVFSVLFAEKGEPVYLRNIGRCYQKLEKPQQAIHSFREYLRKERGLTAEERGEVDGFIKEMEDLKAAQTKAGAPPVGPASPVAPPSLNLAAAPPPSPAAPSLLVAEAPPPASSDRSDDGPIYKRWWFWAGVGAVVLAGTVTALALSSGRSAIVPPCPGICPRDAAGGP